MTSHSACAFADSVIINVSRSAAPCLQYTGGNICRKRYINPPELPVVAPRPSVKEPHSKTEDEN